MEIQFRTVAQRQIADLLWVAETQREVQAILRTFGHDALVVYHMMIAATLDEVMDTDQAEQALDKFRK